MSVAKYLSDGIVYIDLYGIIRSWNQAATRLYGYRESEALGKSVRLIIPRELYWEEHLLRARVLSGRHVANLETFRIRKDGSTVDGVLSLVPIRDGDGRILGAARIARSTELRPAAENVHTEEFEPPVLQGNALSAPLALPSRASASAVFEHGDSEDGQNLADPGQAGRMPLPGRFDRLQRGAGPESRSTFNLTRRERDVVVLIAAGLGDKQIAAHLGISRFTVSRHVSAIIAKMAVRSRTEVAVRSIQEKIFRIDVPLKAEIPLRTVKTGAQ